MERMALLMELFDEPVELIGEAVHGQLEADQQVERCDDKKADSGDRGEEILFHEVTLGITLLVS